MLGRRRNSGCHCWLVQQCFSFASERIQNIGCDKAHAVLAKRISWALLAACLTLVATPALAADSAEHSHFRDHVAPILERHCLGCHHGMTARGKLSLESRDAALRGGESGPAFVPGEPEQSLLVEMISGDAPAMPQDADPLPADAVETLRAWIAAGAPWPAEARLRSLAARESWWSFEPLVAPAIPAASVWTRTPIDAFIEAKLREQQLMPSPEADRRTLLRRVTFDLVGLPPTAEEFQAFLADDDPLAYERRVERFLASPQYGERWARHWLDVVHYGESHGYDKDKRRPNAWPYRDYVIAALNADTPYGQFIREQLAGDVLWPDDPRAVIATGFIAAGPWDFVGHAELAEGTIEKDKTRSLDRDDMLATTVSTFVSLTSHCARCHDHPFDPIAQTDYYRLQAVFAGVDRADRTIATPAGERISYGLKRLDAPRVIHLLGRGNVEARGAEVGPGAIASIEALPAEFAVPSPNDEGARRAALADWIADRRNPLTWRAIANRVWQYHFGQGLVDTPSDFGRNGSRPTHPELLDWLAAQLRDGFVPVAVDTNTAGTMPDAGAQSLKMLHRLIVTSAAYRQSSHAGRDHAQAQRGDSDNRLLWRMNRRRLEAETVRDAVLAATGRLDTRQGGPSFDLFDFEDDHSPRYTYGVLDKPDSTRRAIYRAIVRSVPDPYFETLDCADPSQAAPVRTTTITPLQALTMLNHPFMVREAEHLAERAVQAGDGLAAHVASACQAALGYRLDPPDEETLVAYAQAHGLPAACRVIFNLNEFLFVD